MGKYGTNLEGFGAFEGGVNADKGAPLLSTSSDGETSLLFGPAALREIQAGVANGDFAIPPDAAGDTITEENPLPYWTFTDVDSAGAITCAIVADATAGSGNVLQWSIAASTPSGRSATLTRFVPVASTANQAFVYAAEMTNQSSVSTATLQTTLTQQYYKQDYTTTGTAVSVNGEFLNSLNTFNLTIADPNIAAPKDAAFVLITITTSTVSVSPATVTTQKMFEVRLIRGEQTLLVAERNDPITYEPTMIIQNDGVLRIAPALSTRIFGDLRVFKGIAPFNGDLTVDGDTKLKGANSEYVARITNTATQSLTNNTSTKALFNTASSTPTIGSYDPQGWFNNANDSIDIGQDGFYCVTANAAFAANTTGRREVAIIVNGTNRGSVNVSAASAGTTNLSVSTNLYLVVGDQVTLTLVQTSGGALNTANVAGVFPALSVGRIGA